MKHVIAILGILFLMILWWLPCYMMLQPDSGNGWGILYLPLVIITFFWGWVMHGTYFND